MHEVNEKVSDTQEWLTDSRVCISECPVVPPQRLAPSERADSSMVAAKACAAAAVEALETNDAAALASALRGAAASAVNEKVVGGKLADTALGTSLEYEDGDTLLHLC